MSNLIPHSDGRVDLDTLNESYELARFAMLVNPISIDLRVGRAMDGVRVRKCEYVASIRVSREGNR